MSHTRFVAPALAAAVCILAASSAQAQYKILRTEKIGGEGGFDYVTVDPADRTLWVARSGPAGHVGVYSLETLKQLGDIPGVSAHGAAVDDASGHGFATSKPITMFDAKTYSVIKKIDTPGNPDGYLNDPANHHFYVLSHSAPNVTVLDSNDGSIVGTIDLGGAPEQAVLDGKGKMYIDLEDKDAIAIVDTASMKKTGQYSVAAKGGGCAGLAMDTKNGILFAACRDKKNMIILSAADGHIITDLPTGNGVDGAAFNPATMEAFASAGDGTLTVIKESSPTSFAVEQTLTTPARAKVLTLDPKTNRIYTITAEYGPAPAPAPGAAPGGTPGPRGPRAPMLPGTFQIIEIGK